MAIPNSDHYRVSQNESGRWVVTCGGKPMPGVVGVELRKDTLESEYEGWVRHHPDGDSYVLFRVPARFVKVMTEPANAAEQ